MPEATISNPNPPSPELEPIDPIPDASAVDHAPGLPPPENKRFYPALDGLRAIAVLMVFFEHYLAAPHPALNWGWAGVDIFFVLSGFLITGILFDTQDDPHRVRNFYMRRTLRIFPLYYGIFLCALLTTPIFHWLWSPAWILWLSYLGNYADFLFINSPLRPLGAIVNLHAQPLTPSSLTLLCGHFWSLCVEEQFYLVWPMIVFTIRKRETLRNLCLASIPVMLAARILCLWLVPHKYLAAEFLYRVTPLRADALLIGGFAALAIRGPEAARTLRLGRLLLLPSILAFLLWEICYRHFGPGVLYHPYSADPFMTTFGYTLLDLFAMILILNLLSPHHPLARLLNIKPLRRLGQISYGFYVFHDIFRNLYSQLVGQIFGTHLVQGRAAATALLAFAATLLFSSLSFRFFESPFLRLKARYTR